MDKRTFIKTGGVLAGGALLSRFAGCSQRQGSSPLKNWAGNLQYSTANVHYPQNIQELQDLIHKSPKITALGSRHSFNNIADNTENQVSLREMARVMELDAKAKTVRVDAGTKYGELAPFLQQNGYALHNLASLPHISIAGAVSTATHGSGIKNGNLSTAVSALEFVNAQGELVKMSREKDGDTFAGAVVGLGALGILTSLTLDLQPSFDMKQVVYRNLPMEALKDHFMDLQQMGYSVSLFTDWKNKNINEVWIKSRVIPGEAQEAAHELFGAKAATVDLHPVETQSSETVTPQLGVPGPWFERMPHFKMGFKPSTGKELQSEYFIPIEHAVDAIMAMETLHEKISPHLFISEIRTIQADDLWMSPCYQKTCVTLHTTWKQEVETVMDLLPQLEERLAPFHPIPHWAKIFTMPPVQLQQGYARLNDFRRMVRQLDPGGKFQNGFLERNLFNS
jgi:alditol oxidase